MTLNVNKSISTTCIINVCNVHIKLLALPGCQPFENCWSLSLSSV